MSAFENLLAAQRVAKRFAMEHDSPEAMKQYLQEHPDADRRKHKVKKAPKEKKPRDEDPRAKSKALINKAQKATKGKPAYTAWKNLSRHLREKGDVEGANRADAEASVHRAIMVTEKKR